jgi:arginase
MRAREAGGGVGGTRLAVIGVPSSAGSRQRGLEWAPLALRSKDLLAGLRAEAFEVVDHGDLPMVSSRPDAGSPRERNLARVCQVAARVASTVSSVRGDSVVPLVLGGDCTITIGVLSGMLSGGSDIGLLYFDGDLDLNTPQTTPSGFLDGMVMSYVLGAGSPRLSRLGPTWPLLPEQKVAFFGYNAGCGSVDAPELDALERSGALRYPLERVRAAPREVACQALNELGDRAERILVHFDVDVTDVPAVDFPHPGALPWAAAMTVLGEFLASPRCAGLVVTEFNPLRDRDGSIARQIVDGVVSAIAHGSSAQGVRALRPRGAPSA